MKTSMGFKINNREAINNIILKLNLQQEPMEHRKATKFDKDNYYIT